MKRPPRPALLILFLVSGGCGLIYEVVWTRLFTVIIGNTVFSVSTILTVFMAGLALGSRMTGRLLDRRPIRLTRTYALLEGGIGVYNFLLPLLLKAADPLFGYLYPEGYQSVLVLGLTRLVISFALLIVPATLMGGSLPILIRLYVENIANVGTETGRVYGANTLGAALGAAAAGFLLVPYAGVTFALYFAAALNLGIALLAWRIATKHEVFSMPRQTRDAVRGPRILLAAMFLSGTAALMDEVAWTRVLGLVVGPTTYAFTLMLCSMITGLALGAVLASHLTRRYTILPVILGWIEVGIGFASAALIPIFGQLPLQIGMLVRRYSASFEAIQVLNFFIFFGLMLVPTVLLGMTFPIASKLYAKSDSLLGTEVSAIYAVNTIGAIVGSLAAGFVLIPAVGSQNTLLLAAGLSAVTGLLLTVAAIRDRSFGLRRWLPAAFALLLVPGLFFNPTWDPELMTSGAYKYAPYFARNSDLESMLSSGELLYFKEGAATTVSVRKYRGVTSLSVDGKVDATDAGDMLTEKLLAHIPLLLSTAPKNVAIIGLGSGVTAGAALRYPIEKLDVVETSAEVAQASQFFSHVNHNPLGDSRTELIIGDGRNHLRYANRQYDVIISEPSNPWMAGMAPLFTREFFSEARSRLGPAGIHCQWFHGYNMSIDDLRTVIATFRSEFPHAMLWATEYDFLLLGSVSPLTIDQVVLERNFQRVARDLEEVKIQDLYSILSLLFLRDEELDRFAQGAIANTDDRPVLEFRAPRFIHADTAEENFRSLLSVPRSIAAIPYVQQLLDAATGENHRNKGEMLLRAEIFTDAMREFRLAIATNVNDIRAWKGLVETGRATGQAELQAFFDDIVRTHPLRTVRIAAADFYSQEQDYTRSVQVLDSLLKEQPNDLEALERITDALANQGNARLAEFTDRLLSLAPQNATGLYHLATIRLLQGRLDEAIQAAKRSLERDVLSTRARNLLAIAYSQTFQTELAEAEFRRAIEQAPEDWVSYNNYGLLLLERDRLAEARQQFQHAISLNPENVQGFVGVGESFRQAGNLRAAQSWYRKALRLNPNQPVAKQFVK